MALELSRRGMLGILGAGVGAAIIRPGILMPIKPSLVLPAQGPYITAEMIATAFAQELYKYGARRAVIIQPKQTYVNLSIPQADRTLPLEQFIERHIRPAACSMQASVRGVGSPLELPKGVMEAAQGLAGGFGVRYVQDYDIRTDSLLSRFDILNS